MKKRFSLLVVLMMIVALCISVFAACGGNDEHTTHPDENNDGICDIGGEKLIPDDGGEDDGPIYVGLFTYTKAEGGYVTSAYLNLKEDDTFYFASGFLAQDNLGTYAYNADKTQITLTAQLEQALSGTYNVEVNADGKVVIKDVYYFFYEGAWLSDDFTYDATSAKPVEQPIEIASFFIQDDKDAHLTFFTGNRYELMVSDPDIVSSGTYTEAKSGNTTTYTLTDTLNGENDTYTFTATYTEADGYSDLLLKGTGIADAGIEFVYEIVKNAVVEMSGSYEGTVTETVSLTAYDDGTFEMKFTVWGFESVVTGTWENDAAFNLVITITDGDQKGFVTESTITFALDYTTFKYAGSVSIKDEASFVDYTCELTQA